MKKHITLFIIFLSIFFSNKAFTSEYNEKLQHTSVQLTKNFKKRVSNLINATKRFLSIFSSTSSQVLQDKYVQVMPASVAVIELIDPINFKQTVKDLIDATKRTDIAAILLVIDSSGGTANKFSMLHDLVKGIIKKKPVVGLVVGSATSGGYLVASAANYIFAQNGSDIGYIGVIKEVERWNNTKMVGTDNNKLEADITFELISAGEFKNIWYPQAPQLTSRQREYLQEHIENSYKLFLKMVADNRNLNLEEYKQWAEGKVFLGIDALTIGLVDGIGTFFEASEKLLELINANNPFYIFKEVHFITYEN